MRCGQCDVRRRRSNVLTLHPILLNYRLLAYSHSENSKHGDLNIDVIARVLILFFVIASLFSLSKPSSIPPFYEAAAVFFVTGGITTNGGKKKKKRENRPHDHN